jgi:hypothetical protein
LAGLIRLPSAVMLTFLQSAKYGNISVKLWMRASDYSERKSLCNSEIVSATARRFSAPAAATSLRESARVAEPLWRAAYWPRMAIRPEKIWAQQCKVQRELIGGVRREEFARFTCSGDAIELRRRCRGAARVRVRTASLSALVWQTFNQYEIASYSASLKPKRRNGLRNLVYLRRPSGDRCQFR